MRVVVWCIAVGAVLVSGCGSPSGTSDADAPPASETGHLVIRDPDVPDLPFDDNPDPDQCGIPVRWGLDDPAWVTGTWEGELLQSPVLLYDSHLRLEVTGRVEHGGEVRVILFQENPVLDYYLVEAAGTDAEGWIPAPFLSFDPVVDPTA